MLEAKFSDLIIRLGRMGLPADLEIVKEKPKRFESTFSDFDYVPSRPKLDKGSQITIQITTI